MRLILPFLTVLLLSAVRAEPLTLAVASNFRAPAEEIARRFSEDTGHDVRISSASTGKLHAQIANGAPFDVFLAADSEHPQQLEAAGLAVAGTRATYALGGLVLWSRDAALVGADCRTALADLGSRRLAIANPAHAPFGIAAKQFLDAAGLWQQVEPRLVYGENIAQALHFVATGNAELGLIAASQALDPRLPRATCNWPVPEELHAPIEQQAILLRRAADNPAAQDFIAYLAGDTAAAIVKHFGYGIPE